MNKNKPALYCLLFSGAMPFCVGLYYYLKMTFNYTGFSSGYTLMISHAAFVNLMANGISIMTLTWFGIRNKLKWSWYLILTIIIWVGLNDSFAFTYHWINTNGDFPYPFIPTIVGSVGLKLCKKDVFLEKK